MKQIKGGSESVLNNGASHSTDPNYSRFLFTPNTHSSPYTSVKEVAHKNKQYQRVAGKAVLNDIETYGGAEQSSSLFILKE